jgi:hypothetical protein
MGNTFQSEVEPPELESLADLSENVVYRLNGCDDLTVRKTLQEVAREFVRETQALTARQRLEPLGHGIYPVPALFGGRVVEVREVSVPHGHTLRRGVDWDFDETQQPSVVRMLRPLATVACGHDGRDPVRFTPGVNIVGEEDRRTRVEESRIVAVSVEHLGMFTEKLPHDFLQTYGDAICSGVLARLCSMGQRPWSDPQVAADELRRYENAKSELRMKREAPRNGRFMDMSQLL